MTFSTLERGKAKSVWETLSQWSQEFLVKALKAKWKVQLSGICREAKASTPPHPCPEAGTPPGERQPEPQDSSGPPLDAVAAHLLPAQTGKSNSVPLGLGSFLEQAGTIILTSGRANIEKGRPMCQEPDETFDSFILCGSPVRQIVLDFTDPKMLIFSFLF